MTAVTASSAAHGMLRTWDCSSKAGYDLDVGAHGAGAGQVWYHLHRGPGPRDIHGRAGLQAGEQLPVALQAVQRARGIGCVVVTFTVGGLSVINAVGGAMSEHLPIICITGEHLVSITPVWSVHEQVLLLGIS